MFVFDTSSLLLRTTWLVILKKIAYVIFSISFLKLKTFRVDNSDLSLLHIFFYRQLDFQSEPGSCLAIFENGLETEPTLPAKTCLNDSS